MENEPIIRVPAFNSNYYRVGQPIEVYIREKPDDSYWGIILSVKHQEIVVTTAEGGAAVEKKISISDVTSGKVKLALSR